MPVCATCGTSYGSTVRICIRDGTPLVAGRADDPHLGTLLDSKYRIDAFISAGGMGSVYRAQHVMLGKTVAVKLIKSELVTSDEVVSRFQREARAASNLHHPNIVSVYDLGQTADGTLYIAMEFIDGPSLKDAISRNGPMAPAEAAAILRQVASALSTAHRKQIVHRDLKSHNLMLASGDDGRTVVKLVDFGIAKTFDESTQLTAAGFMMGTPHYMSPEQAAGKPVDHRADLYSLGVILYEMLTGEVPFGDAALTSVLVRLATEVPPAPSTRRPDLRVPPALDAVAMRCLEKDPDKRFQSADEFAAALELALTDVQSQQTVARPAAPPVPETLLRPVDTRRYASAPVEDAAAVPAPPPRPSNRRVAAGLVVVAALATGIAWVVGRSGDPAEEGSTPQVSSTPAPPPAGSATGPVPGATPAPIAAPIPSLPEATADPARPRPVSPDTRPIPAGAPAQTSNGQGRPEGQVAVTPPAPQPAPSPAPQAASTPAPQAVPTPEPPAAAAPAPVTPVLPPAQAARNDITVSVTCKGFPDVCDTIRSEIVQALQRDRIAVVGNQAAATVALTVNVALVSETPSSQFGTPIITRTYSVDLTGVSRGTALAMPAPRVFGFDNVFGRPRLQDNARLIAASAVESMRGFSTDQNR
jgi:serine/threonine-protein kinase